MIVPIGSTPMRSLPSSSHRAPLCDTIPPDSSPSSSAFLIREWFYFFFLLVSGPPEFFFPPAVIPLHRNFGCFWLLFSSVSFFFPLSYWSFYGLIPQSSHQWPFRFFSRVPFPSHSMLCYSNVLTRMPLQRPLPMSYTYLPLSLSLSLSVGRSDSGMWFCPKGFSLRVGRTDL